MKVFRSVRIGIIVGALLLLIAAQHTPSMAQSDRPIVTATATPYPMVTATPSPVRPSGSKPTPSLANTTTDRDGATNSPPRPLRDRFEPRADDKVTQVREGIYHISRETDDPLQINVLLFDLTAPEFDVRSGLGGNWLSGRTQTSTMVAEYGAVAGVNGDLFAEQGVPQGLTIRGGQVVIPPKHRATFAWTTDREPVIGYYTDSWTWQAEVIAANGAQRQLGEYNMACGYDTICLYNEFARVAYAEWGDVKVVLSPSGRVRAIVQGEALDIEPGERVLKGTGTGAEWLLANVAVGDTVQVNTVTDPPLDNIAESISGGPILVQEGEFFQDCLCKLMDCTYVALADLPPSGTLCEDFDTDWKEAHYEYVYMPRTAVGYDRAKQTLIVIVIDGYQLGFSRGALQEELADLFIEFGAYTAMELDGGGSSTMVVEDEIVNYPSDQTGERYVANALLFMWNEGAGEATDTTMLVPRNGRGLTAR